MAGIYLHIPFCKQACTYCNFHFSTLLKEKDKVLQAMLKEIELQKNFFPKKTNVETIYFGGGTPSLLDIKYINLFIDKINSIFSVDTNAEITLEANPDDLTLAYLSSLKKETLVNRLSIGIQSFRDEDLLYMHRAHNAQEAKTCIATAQDIGFEQLTIDLIYGTPTMNNEQWQANLQTAFSFQLPHISCYALTVEEKTVLFSKIKKQAQAAPDDEQIAQQFNILIQAMGKHNYVHYEISNFCLSPNFAKHNTNYWKGVPYLGIGASAHSFNGTHRFWNISNNAIYTKNIMDNKLTQEQEFLTKENRYNEYVMTAIRTIFGIDKSKLLVDFGESYLQHFLFEVSPFIDNKWVQENNDIYTLTHNGKLFCDYITEHLFVEEME